MVDSNSNSMNAISGRTYHKQKKYSTILAVKKVVPLRDVQNRNTPSPDPSISAATKPSHVDGEALRKLDTEQENTHRLNFKPYCSQEQPMSVRHESVVPHLFDSESDQDKKRRDRLLNLHNFLNHFDESDQSEYIFKRLRCLPPSELSRHAVELEKRSMQLSVEEAKEIQRMRALNILGKSSMSNQ